MNGNQRERTVAGLATGVRAGPVQGTPGDSGCLPATSGIPRQADLITGLAGSVPDPASVRARDSSQNPASP